MRFSGDRLLMLGAAVTAAGVAIGVAYWIYGRQSTPATTFWHAPGYLSITITGAGLLVMIVGLFSPSADVGAQHQTGGDGSTNIQSGRDTTINRS